MLRDIAVLSLCFQDDIGRDVEMNLEVDSLLGEFQRVIFHYCEDKKTLDQVLDAREKIHDYIVRNTKEPERVL